MNLWTACAIMQKYYQNKLTYRIFCANGDVSVITNFWNFQKLYFKHPKNNILINIKTFWQLCEPVRSVECQNWIGRQQ